MTAPLYASLGAAPPVGGRPSGAAPTGPHAAGDVRAWRQSAPAVRPFRARARCCVALSRAISARGSLGTLTVSGTADGRLAPRLHIPGHDGHAPENARVRKFGGSKASAVSAFV